MSAGKPQTDAARPRRPAVRLLTGYPAAGAVLAGFWLLMVGSLADKCNTYDELAHLTAGYAYWKFNDYRMDPENGNLPQRVMGLPLLFENYRFPPLSHPAWWASDEWNVGFRFFFELGNDVRRMLLEGRAAMGLLAVALGLLVYAWSRRLFGPGGGMISLLLYVFNPSILANGALMTSDMAGALFFLAAAWCIWRLLHRIDPGTVLLCGLATGALFLSKMSAVFILPVAGLLVVLRLLVSRSLTVWLGRGWRIVSRPRQLIAFTLAATASGAIAYVMIWAVYGFRYEMMDDALPGRDRPNYPWPVLLNTQGLVREGIVFARDNRLLPEAYLYGYAHVYKFGRNRAAFLNGQYSTAGWRSFFPYTFLVKTPLAVFAVALLAAAAALATWRSTRADGEDDRQGAEQGAGTRKDGPAGSTWAVARRGLYPTAPLWLLMGVYWAAVIASRLNIGHRHILPVYAPMFVLAGAAVYWLRKRPRTVGALLVAAMALLVGETLYRWPNYLAYFNQIVGGPANGYKHLVDSSLEWGQELPALKRYLDGRGLSTTAERPVYLAYFGTASPEYYGIRPRYLPGEAPMDRMRRPEFRCLMPGWQDMDQLRETVLNDPSSYLLGGGVYCISATMLQPVLHNAPGPWCARYEDLYQKALAASRPLLDAGADRAARQAIWQAHRPLEWQELLRVMDGLRFARLCAHLRHRQRGPDAVLNYAIFIFDLSDQEVRQALEGPPAEMGECVLDKRWP